VADATGAARPTRSCRGAGAVGQNVAMTTWKPHALAKPHEDQLALRMGDKVQTTVDLHNVPTGTHGKVILANGFNWQRYRVLFVNGEEIGDLDGRNIEAIGSTKKRLAKKST
jgi:hypothetical protein